MTQPRPSAERYGVDDTVVVVIDAQNDFCHPEGSAARAGLSVDAMGAASDRLVALVDTARSAGVPVVFVRTHHDDEVDSAEWRHRLAGGIGPGHRPASPNCVTGTWGAEFFRVRPRPDEPVVTKHRYSAFHGTNLADVLRGMDRTSLLFTGFTTNVCVDSSLRAGLFHDFLVSVVEDCCAAFDPDEHRSAVATIGRYFGGVTTSDDLARGWLTGPR